MRNLLSKVRMPGARSKKKIKNQKEESGSAESGSQDNGSSSGGASVTQNAEVEPESLKERASEKANKDGEIVNEIMAKLNIDNTAYTVEEKLEALCVIFRETITENVMYKNQCATLIEQLEKNAQTKIALSNLVEALRKQIDLKEEEGNLKLQEEAHKRLECTQSFETVIKDLTKLVTQNSDQNKTLKVENESLQSKMSELLKAHEAYGNKYVTLQQEYGLQMKLFEAQLAKAKLEKAEVSANFNKERLELQKSLLESERSVTTLMGREDNMKEQLEIYQSQHSDMEKNIGTTAKSFQNFRKEIDRVTKQLRKVERDTDEWKLKFEESQEQILKMNKQNLERENDVGLLKRKLAAMEKLNRHLHQERNDMFNTLEELKKN